MQKIAWTFASVNRSSDLPKQNEPDLLKQAKSAQLIEQDRPKAISGSSLLADANARLMALREQFARTKTDAKPPTEPQNLELPAHLGWGNTRLMQRVGTPPSCKRKVESSAAWLNLPKITNPPPIEQPPATQPDIKLSPQLADAFLKHELVATARVWLLLRQIDINGRGWVAVSVARQQLTTKTSARRLVGWRRLRSILQAGNGIFWQRDQERIWLRSVTKVSDKLEVERLHRPIIIPIETIVANIQTTRATFYAISHSQRNGPISRAKLTELTGVSERTQRRYDWVANVQKTTNYCLGKAGETQEETVWHQRHAAFEFVDKQGRHGAAGEKYCAFQLPNSYTVHYQAAATGRTRKINQQLRQDLVKYRAQGNSQARLNVRLAVEEKRRFGRKLFFDNGKAAMRQGDSYLKTKSNSKRAFWIHFA